MFKYIYLYKLLNYHGLLWVAFVKIQWLWRVLTLINFRLLNMNFGGKEQLSSQNKRSSKGLIAIECLSKNLERFSLPDNQQRSRVHSPEPMGDENVRHSWCQKKGSSKAITDWIITEDASQQWNTSHTFSEITQVSLYQIFFMRYNDSIFHISCWIIA